MEKRHSSLRKLPKPSVGCFPDTGNSSLADTWWSSRRNCWKVGIVGIFPVLTVCEAEQKFICFMGIPGQLDQGVQMLLLHPLFVSFLLSSPPSLSPGCLASRQEERRAPLTPPNRHPTAQVTGIVTSTHYSLSKHQGRPVAGTVRVSPCKQGARCLHGPDVKHKPTPKAREQVGTMVDPPPWSKGARDMKLLKERRMLNRQHCSRGQSWQVLTRTFQVGLK